MTVDDLMDLLSLMMADDRISGDTEVRLMTRTEGQVESSLLGLSTSHDVEGLDTLDPADVVYFCDGNRMGDGNARAWEVVHRLPGS